MLFAGAVRFGGWLNGQARPGVGDALCSTAHTFRFRIPPYFGQDIGKASLMCLVGHSVLHGHPLAAMAAADRMTPSNWSRARLRQTWDPEGAADWHPPKSLVDPKRKCLNDEAFRPTHHRKTARRTRNLLGVCIAGFFDPNVCAIVPRGIDSSLIQRAITIIFGGTLTSSLFLRQYHCTVPTGGRSLALHSSESSAVSL